MPATPFVEMEYQRVPLEEMKSQYDELLRRLPSADARGIIDVVKEWTHLRSRYQTMSQLNEVRYTIDTRDVAIKEERKFLDEQQPTVEDWNTTMRRALLAHPRRDALEKEYGHQFMTSMETAVQTFDPKISEHLKKQADLSMKYTDLVASAKIEFRGKTYNLSGLEQFFNDENRDVRHEALRKRYEFFEQNAAEFDRIYDELVQLRHDMARQLGYPNYIPLAYKLLFRTDYAPDQVAVLREEVRQHVVPLVARGR